MDQFDFVVVNELYDESLLLLHMQLRLRIVDMLYLQSKNFSNPKVDVTPKVSARILELNQLDLDIHTYATARLKVTIAALEPTFSVMLERFQDLKREAEQKCLQFQARSLGSGDEKLPSRLKLQRTRCLEDVCRENLYCSIGSFAPTPQMLALWNRKSAHGNTPGQQQQKKKKKKNLAQQQCESSLLGDGYCDDENNRVECSYDAGDCQPQHGEL